MFHKSQGVNFLRVPLVETADKECETEASFFKPKDDKEAMAFNIDNSSTSQFKALLGITENHFDFIFALIKDSLREPKNSCRPKDKLVVTLMILKTGLTFEAVSAFFCVTAVTISRWFEETIYAFAEISKAGVYWLPKEQVQARMPKAFKTHFPNTRAILDCSEVPMTTPSGQAEQTYCYSNYKSCHTMKYLVACAPSGEITFVSGAYGGRTTDCEIVNQSGILNLIQPEDLILADKAGRFLGSISNLSSFSIWAIIALTLTSIS